MIRHRDWGLAAIVVVSGCATAMWGNAIATGGIAAAVDYSKGTGYDYDTRLVITMDKAGRK